MASLRTWRWSVLYQTSTHKRGTIIGTRADAEREAMRQHDLLVLRGYDADALAWWVGEEEEQTQVAR